eukprot:scaffold4619_cov59-Phaeocystis_antarctica.AAC.2
MALVSSGFMHLAVRTSTLDRLTWIESKSLSDPVSAASNAACCAEDITTSNCAPLCCRCGRVPRLHQQHRVPDGADALAEQRQVGAHVGLPDHVVAHPEERVLLPQPLLLEEVGERVEQRGDRRVEGPAHEHGGLAHVRRPLLLQPLAHGQPVLLFPEGEEVLVDVAVLCVVLGVLGLACLVERNVSVDLLHCVARQLR